MSAGGLHPEVLAPLGFAAIGALGVLLGVALLPSTRSFLGRPWSPRLLATLAGVTALAALLLVVFVSVQWFASGAALSFDPAHPLLRLDRFSAFASALIGAAAFLACALAIY